MTKIQKKIVKKTQFKHTQIKMKNLWPGCYTKVIAFESKLNKIMKFNYQIIQCWRMQIKKKTVKNYESTQVSLQTATIGIKSG